jgi:cytochrome c-type biogenesis protein CcsB
VTSQGWAHLSNNLLYSAMLVYAGALVCYAADLAFGPRFGRAPAQSATAVTSEPIDRALPARAAATVGATVGSGPGSTATSPDPEPGAAGAAPPLPPSPARDVYRWGRIALSLTVLAFALHAGSVLSRGLSAGRAPWGNMFEFSTTGALAVTGIFLVLMTRRDIRYLGLFVLAPVLLTLGAAVTVLYTESEQLVPALKSVWLLIHVTAAIIASGILTIGFAQTICFLVQDRREHRGDGSPAFMDRFPDAATLDRAAYRMHAFAFPIWTFAVIAGAIWAENAWGRYWGWDPKETWAFITWMVYAIYLHARSTTGWRGRKASYIALIGYTTFLFNYVAVNLWLNGLHSYAGVG